MTMHAPITDTHPTRYWESLEDGRVRCLLCPAHCRMKEGQRGACFVRGCREGRVVLTTYGRSSGFCVDPIEKKPLNHFLPGTPVLSFGTAGCNLSCRYCQNWDISKSRQWDRLADTASPEDIALAAEKLGCRSVACTYNDPVIFHEYAIDIARACHERGILTVAVTAGYICEEPRREFFRYMDAANIDLKAFTERFYKKLCGAELGNVLETLQYVKQHTDTWLELTTLVIPGENDSDEELDAMTRWVVQSLGPDVPMHFTAFHPDYKMMDVPPTPISSLIRARDIARKNGVRFAYTGNVRDARGGSTWCPNCGELLIERIGYAIGRWNLDASGRCGACATPCPGQFDASPGQWGSRRMPVQLGPPI